MGWTILLTILFVLCVILLLPVRVKGFFADGKWGVSVYYAWFRLFHKESEEKTPPVTPPKPEDVPEGTAPTAEQMPEPSASAQSSPQPEAPPAPKPEKPAAEAVPKPETVTAEVKPDEKPEKPKKEKRKKRRRKEEPAAESADLPEEETPAEKPKKKRGIRGFIERLKPHSLSDVMGLVRDGCAALSPALRFLTKHLHFRHIRLYAAIGTDDAAKTAERYGAISAAVFNLIGQLQCWVDFQADECRILADFFNDKITFRASGELRVSPMAAILLVLILGGRFLWRTVRRFRREDKEAKLRAQETAPLPAEA